MIPVSLAHGRDPRRNPDAEWIEGVRLRFPTEPYLDRALVRKLDQRRYGRYQPLTALSAHEQLGRFLAAQLDGPFEISDVKPLSGGTSKEQFAFRLRWQDGARQRDERLVLRVQPAQSVVETHRLREFQIVGAVKAAGIPVPDVYWVDEDAAYFQQPALIYSFCDGVARPPESDNLSSVRGGFGPHWRAILAPQFIETLAKIHIFDCDPANVSAFDIPPAGSTEGVVQTLNLWHRSWEEDRLEAVPLVTLAAQWLQANAPPIDHVSLIHCDYRPGNFLFDPVGGKITAVLDWELARFGDRHEDLATILLEPLGEYDEDGTFLVGGLCPKDEFLARYEAASGLSVDPVRLRYYEIYNYWRSVCMSLGSATRCVVAQKTHQDIVVAFNTYVAGLMLSDLQKALEEVMNDGA